MPHTILPLPARPGRSLASPAVVAVLDRIRFVLDEREDMAEFAWFAREYPRVYRHHFQHAQFRLHAIYSSFESWHLHFARRLASGRHRDTFEMAQGNEEVQRICWDFESYLVALSAALDVLARICGMPFASTCLRALRTFARRRRRVGSRTSFARLKINGRSV